MRPPITTFKQHYARNYGEPVGKIALDAGLVCPNRLQGGCIYCAPDSFRPFYLETGDSIETQLSKGRIFLARRGVAKYFGYFQQETTTAAPRTDLMPQFEHVMAARDCVGLIISTRPDFVGRELLDDLEQLRQRHGKEIVIELGLQSARNATLRFLNRNHSVEDFTAAVDRIQRAGEIEVGVHLILGLPGEKFQDMVQTVRLIAGLGLGHVKFHHLQVIRGTKLHAMYVARPFPVFDSHDYFRLLAELLGYIPPQVIIHRLWSTSPPALLVAPHWHRAIPQLQDDLLHIMEERSLYQGRYLETGQPGHGPAPAVDFRLPAFFRS
jgi:radical SAM protein (TIGR01212 family)